VLEFFNGTSSVPADFPRISTDGIQITESDGNQWPLPSGSAISDSGSEFFTQKKEWVTKNLPYTSLNFSDGSRFTTGYTKAHVDGRFYVADAFHPTSQTFVGTLDARKLKPQFPPDLSSSRASLVTKGTIAVAACAPTNQVAHVASTLGELLQDVPRVPGLALWQSRLRALETLASAGDEFLNIVFGALPTISDMTDFVKGVHTVDKAVDQFIRDSGRTVRRKYVFPTEETTTVDILPNASPVGYSGFEEAGNNQLYGVCAAGLPSYETVRTRVTKREIWFSGAFTYHLPEWFDSHSREDRKLLTAKLLGAQPDLNTLWQLAPWSWAVDWFSDAGAFVKNLQSMISYGTVMRYGYVMEKTTTTDTFSAGSVKSNPISPYKETYKGRPYPSVAPITLRTTTKKRVQANPFGFGLSWDGMSTIQQAIVAALGITRVVR